MRRAPVHLASSTPAIPSEPSLSARPARGRARPEGIGRLLDDFESTTLAELDAVALLNRIDTKYLLSASQLVEILPALADDYLVLEIGGQRLHQYRTLYFDTPDFALYRHHHAGRPVRQKVRSRTYLDTGLAFFEIKAKDSLGRTSKHRQKTGLPLTELTAEARVLLAPHVALDARDFEPKLRNDFFRITLVGRACPERLTLDLNVQFDYDGRTAILPGVVIAELKQSDADYGSPFVQRMSERGLLPTSLSKYCVGVALLVPDLEHEAFEPKLRALESLGRGEPDAS
jgi:hypothetical protein